MSCRYSCFGVKTRENRVIICVILAVLTCLPLIKTFCILSSKLRGRLFTIFAVSYISCAYFWHASIAIDCWRGRAH